MTTIAMTTIPVPVEEAVLRRLEEQGAEVGQSPIEYASEVLARVTGLKPFQTLVEGNEACLRAEGYMSEAEVARAIEEGVEEVRRSR